MKEKEVKIEETDADWSEEYKGDRPVDDSKWFSDIVPEGAISFRADITFKDEGEKQINKWEKEIIRFTITHDGVEKTMDVPALQYNYLKVLAQNKPLIGKVFEHERTGEGQRNTRRNIKPKN